MGSSGSFTTALLCALHTLKRDFVLPRDLADIELKLLNEPIGKQDQYIAAFGGITCFRFLPDDQRECRTSENHRRTLWPTSKTTCSCSSTGSSRNGVRHSPRPGLKNQTERL